ncbi:unnamed protein product [Paramecium primaurelia]|uniref:Uncharacterized protein n=2 Tax=Paramecium primaurelia TaxID=5886 RepID=A0A8S1QIJ9_PARPR|nr:unnamed protein product [Paramecium primaurelia]
MRSNIKQTHYVLDFSDIEDISDNVSESSSYQQNQPPVSPPRSDIKQLQQGSSLQPVKKETVEIPSLIIQQEEDQIPRRKIDNNIIQRWEVNFDELSEYEEPESAPESIQLQKESSPHIEEPQYIEQFFEDQQIIDEVEIDQDQLILERPKDVQKQTLIMKQEFQLKDKQNAHILTNPINLSQKDYLNDCNTITPKKDINQDIQIPKCKQIVKQKFYNPKNSLIYLRLRGREDLYKRNEIVVDEKQKPQEVDQLLEGLDCINNLLIDLSNFKEKKKNEVDKNKQVPLQIQKHRVDQNSVNNTEKKSIKIVQIKEQKQQENQVEIQKIQEQKQIESVQKQQVQIESAQKQQVQKQIESAQKQQLQQEAALARQIRKEIQQQEKELKKQQEQKQVYKILTKKLINQGLPLYRCLLRQKQKDFIKWLRFSEIALINEGEKEIYRFEKRLSDQMFLQIHKQNMKSITITKQYMFDPITLHYVKKKENLQENTSLEQEKQIKQDQDQKIINNKINNECKIQKEQKQSKQKKLTKKDSSDCVELLEEDQNKQTIINKEKGIQSNSDDEDFDLLDADRIQILKIVIDKRKYNNRQQLQQQNQLIQPQDEYKQSDDGVIVRQRIDQQNEHFQKEEQYPQIQQEQKNNLYLPVNKSRQGIDNQNEIKQKKHRNYKYKEQPLSRLETNDEIKKKEKIYDKRKEKKKQDFLQLLNEIEIEQKQQQLKEEEQKRKYKAILQQNKDKLRVQNYEQKNKLKNLEYFQQQQVNTKIQKDQRINESKIDRIIAKSEIKQDLQSCKSSSVAKKSSVEKGIISINKLFAETQLKRLRRNETDSDDSDEFSQVERNRNYLKKSKK